LEPFGTQSYVHNPAWTHAGGIVYRGSGAPQILLVRARPKPHDWVLPKGHIEKGETPDDCARREIREEAGVEAEPLAFLGEDAFSTPDGKNVHAAFFLLAFVRAVAAAENREVRWCAFAEALSLVQFEGARHIIRAAERKLA
jgi:8-oxo-dGTP pyrophosphatase MutT (NUDIX family)